MPTGDQGTQGVSPDEAFAVLGDDTRLQILQVLGEADEPLAFSELFDRVKYETTANFSYHLEKVLGHFVRRTEAGYSLRRAGERVVEAVLSGAVTETPVRERAPVDVPCFLCGGTMEVSYREEDVGLFCPSCGGTRGGTSRTAAWADDKDGDIVGHVALPPAGVRDRSPRELLRAAEIWTVSEAQLVARSVCPRCSARVEQDVAVCTEHDPDDGRCVACDQRFAVTVRVGCRNCIYSLESIFTIRLLADPHLMTFMMDHGIDPFAPAGFHITNLEDEAVLSSDPFRARFTFTDDDEAIALTVNDDLSVEEATRTRLDATTPTHASSAPARND